MVQQSNDNNSTLAAKVVRFETVLDKKIPDLVTLVNSLEEHTKTFILEAEELRAIRENLKEELHRSVQNSINKAVPAIANEISKKFNEKNSHFLDDQFTSMQNLQRSASKTINDFNGLTWKCLGFSVLASALSGVIIFLLCYVLVIQKPEPQELTPVQQSLMWYGQVMLDKFKELTSHDQKILKDAVDAGKQHK